jgi:hypothetical protein
MRVHARFVLPPLVIACVTVLVLVRYFLHLVEAAAVVGGDDDVVGLAYRASAPGGRCGGGVLERCGRRG